MCELSAIKEKVLRKRRSQMEDEDYSTFKVVLLGASDVGKSSLVLRFVKGKFFERRENTIGGFY